MKELSVIIPSRTDAKFLACAEAVRRNEPGARIILIDDGLKLDWLPRPGLSPCLGHRIGKPFNFSRNVNAGIQLACPDDCVVLNDDALLETMGGLSLLQRAAEDNPKFGVIAASTNSAGNRSQYPMQIGLREDSRMVCFVCVLIPRRTIEAVGLLDERFTGYGCEDDDYCLRVRRAGMRIGIHDGCFVDHLSMPSTFRGPAGAGGDYLPNLEIFKRKWGMDNWGNPA
jgi:hypothetical protein